MSESENASVPAMPPPPPIDSDFQKQMEAGMEAGRLAQLGQGDIVSAPLPENDAEQSAP